MLRAIEAEPAIQRGISPVRCAGLGSRAARRDDPKRSLRGYGRKPITSAFVIAGAFRSLADSR